MHEQVAALTSTAAVSTANPAGWNRLPRLPLVAAAEPTPQTITRRAAIVSMVAAVLVAVGSLFNETWWEKNTFSARRRRGQDVRRLTGRNAWTDDSWTWAFPTLLRGVSAFGVMAGAMFLGLNDGGFGQWRRAIGASLGIVAAFCLATSSLIAGLYWRPLLIEQAAGLTITSTSTEGLARIAFGLPIVTAAGALGAVACLVVAVALLGRRQRPAGSPEGIHRSSE